MHRLVSRTALIATTTLWWLALAGLILLAVVAVGVRIGVDYVMGDPQRLESILNSNSTQVSVESSQVSWEVLIPTIRTTGMLLETEDVNVRIDELYLRPRILPSILNLRPIFDSSRINNAQIDFFLREDEDDADFDFEAAFSILLLFSSSGNFSINDSTLLFHGSKGGTLPVHVRFLDNYHNSNNWWINASLGVGDFIPNLQFNLLNNGNFPETIEDLDFTLNLRTTALVVPQDFLLPESDIELSARNAEGWVRFSNESFEQVQLNFSELRYQQQPADGLFANITLWPRAGTSGLNSNEWQGLVPSIRHGDKVLVENLYLSDGTHNEQPQIYLSADLIEARNILEVAQPFATELQRIDIDGSMRNLRALIPTESPLDSFATTLMNGGGISLLDEPRLAIKKIDTALSFDHGIIEAMLDTPLLLDLGDLYHQPWDFDLIRGALSIDVSNPQRLKMSLGNATLKMQELSAMTNLVINAPLGNENTADHGRDMLNLAIDFDNMPISYKDRLIPYKLLGPETEARIRPMLSDGSVAGKVRISIDNKDRLDYQLDIGFSDTTLAYLPDRPKVRKLGGSLRLTNDLLTASGNGYLLNTKVEMPDMRFDLARNHMDIDLNTTTTVNAMIELASVFLEDESIGMPTGLDVINPVSIAAKLSIPLDTPTRLEYQVQLDMQDNLVHFTQLPDFPLQITQGGVMIDNGVLTQTRPLRGSWYNEDIEVRLEPANIVDGEDLVIHTTTTMPSSLLNLATGAKKQLFTGSGSMKARIVFHPTSFRLKNSSVESDLTHMQFHLPEGWDKPKGQQLIASARYTANQQEGGLVQFSLPGYAKGRLTVDDTSSPLRGWVGLGFASLAEPPGKSSQLHLIARLTKFHLFRWQKWWEELQPFTSDLSSALEQDNDNTSTDTHTTRQAAVSSSGSAEELPQQPQLSFSLPNILNLLHIQFIANDIVLSEGVSISHFKALAKQEDKALRLSIDSDQISGNAKIALVPDTVHKVVLDKLLIPEFKQTQEQPPPGEKREASESPEQQQPVKKPQPHTEKRTPDPLADIDMTQVGMIDFTIKRLEYGANPLGAWSWQMRPTENGARLQNLVASYKKTTLQGEAEWVKLKEEDTQTTLYIDLESKEVEDLAQLVNAENGKISMFLQWPGSPAAFDLPAAKGNLNINFSNGLIKTDTPALRALNFLGLLNIGTIGRRLRLDFSDQGDNVSFDLAHGDFSLMDGKVTNVTPFVFLGPVISFSVRGETDLQTQQIQQDMVIRLSVGEALPLAAILIGSTPQTAILLYLSNLLLDSPISALTSARYKISGSLQEPEFELVQLLGGGSLTSGPDPDP